MAGIKTFETFRKKIGQGDLGIFCEQSGILLSSGIPIVDVLRTLGGQTKNKSFSEQIKSVQDMIVQGHRLSESFEKSGKKLPQVFIQMLKVGESSGDLDKIFKSLGVFYQEQDEIRKEVSGTLIYPVIVIIVALAVVIFLLTFVLPVFQDIFLSMDVELPLLTQVFLKISSFVRNTWWLGIIIFPLAILAIRATRKSANIALFEDQLVLKMPIIGKLLFNLETIRFSKALGILLGSGIDIVTALDIGSGVVSNRYIRSQIQFVSGRVRTGAGLTESFLKTHLFQSSFCEMIAVGEETGLLDSALLRVSEYYEKEFRRSTKKITTILEPVVIVFVGVIVFMIVLSTMMPMFGIYEMYNQML